MTIVFPTLFRRGGRGGSRGGYCGDQGGEGRNYGSDRGGGYGGGGGRGGGGYRSVPQTPAAPRIEDPKDFPALGGASAGVKTKE